MWTCEQSWVTSKQVTLLAFRHKNRKQGTKDQELYCHYTGTKMLQVKQNAAFRIYMSTEKLLEIGLEYLTGLFMLTRKFTLYSNCHKTPSPYETVQHSLWLMTDLAIPTNYNIFRFVCACYRERYIYHMPELMSHRKSLHFLHGDMLPRKLHSSHVHFPFTIYTSWKLATNFSRTSHNLR